MIIYVDADACPVKEEAAKVAYRHQARIIFVSNAWMRLPDYPHVERQVVAEGADQADNWIAERITASDIVVTQDIPLASRCLRVGARAIGNTGKPFTNASIGMALAMRELSQHMRETGETRGFNATFTPRDRSRFLEQLELAVQQIKRGHVR